MTDPYARPCPDGSMRHTRAVALDCPFCHPEAHDRCGCLPDRPHAEATED